VNDEFRCLFDTKQYIFPVFSSFLIQVRLWKWKEVCYATFWRKGIYSRL